MWWKMENWKKSENEKGFIYYINDETNFKQWDHPKFSDVKQAIDDCNYVTYPLYRLAFKLRVLQKSLYLEEVPLSIITDIFKRHRLGNSESSLTLETCDLEAVLTDIFYSAKKHNHTNIDIDFATEIVINFLFNVFDREGNIRVFSTKIVLGILSSANLLELHKFLFSLCADHNNCITRLRLQVLLLKIHEVIKYLHEDSFLGLKNINFTIESCFKNSPGLVGITESYFVGWLETDPPFLSWLSLIGKLKSSETVMHAVKCKTCKSRPLIGLRYSCVRCSRYNQCQRCFLTGRISHSHKLSHSVREYGGVRVSKEYSNPVVKKICMLFCPLAVGPNFTVIRPTSCFTRDTIKPYQSADPLCDVEPLSPPQLQLQGVIRQLESQNRELQQMLIFGNYSDKEMKKYLEEYRVFMAGNIRKLKMLRNQINTSTDSDLVQYTKPQNINITNLQSTPMVRYTKNDKYPNFVTEKNVSPVTMTTEINDSIYQQYDSYKVDDVNPDVANQRCFTNLDGYKDCNYWKKDTFSPKLNPPVSEPKSNKYNPSKSTVKVLHNDLDEALARLQQILANNFSLEDSLNPMDNTNLKYAVTEVEGMLTSIIDNVESSRSNSVLPGRTKS